MAISQIIVSMVSLGRTREHIGDETICELKVTLHVVINRKDPLLSCTRTPIKVRLAIQSLLIQQFRAKYYQPNHHALSLLSGTPAGATRVSSASRVSGSRGL